MPNEAAPRSSEYWHDRAEEARASSEAMHDPLAVAPCSRSLKCTTSWLSEHPNTSGALRSVSRGPRPAGAAAPAGLPQPSERNSLPQ
jgi:hypothetical protein